MIDGYFKLLTSLQLSNLTISLCIWQYSNGQLRRIGNRSPTWLLTSLLASFVSTQNILEAMSKIWPREFVEDRNCWAWNLVQQGWLDLEQKKKNHNKLVITWPHHRMHLSKDMAHSKWVEDDRIHRIGVQSQLFDHCQTVHHPKLRYNWFNSLKDLLG